MVFLPAVICLYSNITPVITALYSVCLLLFWLADSVQEQISMTTAHDSVTDRRVKACREGEQASSGRTSSLAMVAGQAVACT